DNHPTKSIPFSAKHLKEAYQLGAEKFGWSKRNPEPRSMRDGDLLVGWGMATATYPAHKMSAAAKVILRADNTATVQCATHDLGTGAYTALTQISSEQLGLPFEKVTFELGKSDFPLGRWRADQTRRAPSARRSTKRRSCCTRRSRNSR